LSAPAAVNDVIVSESKLLAGTHDVLLLHDHHVTDVSLQRGREGVGRQLPLNFSLSENFSFNSTKFGAEHTPFWGNLGAKLTF